MKKYRPNFIRGIGLLITNFIAALIIVSGVQDNELLLIYLLSIVTLMAWLALYLQWVSYNKLTQDELNSIKDVKIILDIGGFFQILAVLNIFDSNLKLVILLISSLFILISLYRMKNKISKGL